MTLPALLVLPALLMAAAAPPLRLERIAWMQGCWRAESPARVIEETWMAPRGGTMIGVSRTVRGDSLAAYEMILLREKEGALAYIAHPSGQARNTFTAREASDSMVVFSDPTHDFPQQVGYRRVGADSLVAWIAGERGGALSRGVEEQELTDRRVR